MLRPAGDIATVKTVKAALALAKRGLTLLRAKRTMEAMLEGGEVAVLVPVMERFATLSRELAAAGITATRVANTPVDVKATRLSLGLSQEQFALRFGLDPDAVANWEQGRRKPDQAAQAYLRVIAAAPKEARLAQEGQPLGSARLRNKLRLELAATHARLARQAALFMEEMRRLGIDKVPEEVEGRRQLADRLARHLSGAAEVEKASERQN